MTRSEPLRYPTTPMQEGMLFHSVSAPGTGVEIEQIVCTSRERLDVGCLEEAWRRIVERHDALRTRFRWDTGPRDGGPVQEVASTAEVRVQVEAPGTDLDGLLARDRAEDFDLARSCMRVRVCPGPADWSMVWSFHHAILDGRSFPLVLRELFDCYSALRDGRAWIAPAVPARFAAFAEYVRGRDDAQSRAFWEDLLRGHEAPDHPLVDRRGPGNSGDFGAFEVRLGEDVAEEARRFASAKGVTLNTMFQLAWGLTLHTHTRAADVVFGGTRACRHVPVAGVADIVGLLINTVPVRVSAARDSVASALRETRERWLGMRAHETTALTSIQRWLGSAAPLFDTIAVFERSELRDDLRGLGGAWLDRDFAYRGRTGYPLTLIGYDGASPLFRLEYDRALMDDGLARDLLDQTVNGLSALPASAGARPSHVPVHTREERERVLELATPRLVEADDASTIVERFESHAAARPLAPAVGAAGDRLDYATLASRSARLARALLARGIGRGSRVAVMAERRADAVVTMLGVLRAGACYVPIDHDSPAERVRYIAEDATLDLILRDGGNPVADIETRDPVAFAATAPADGALPAPSPDAAAYVIYTSGSTGRPKGVVVTHRNVVRLMEGCATRFELGPTDVWSCFHSFAFDFSVWEMWGALMTGGSTVIASANEVRSPQHFAELLAREGVTVLSQTPSAFRQLQGELTARAADYRLRYVVFGGEALDPTTLRPWLDAFGDRAALINMYGITETTVHVTFRRITRADTTRADSVIGAPLPHLGLLLLNAEGGLAPRGAPAELFVSGGGVASGYLNRPELTAERFVEHPALPGVRFYRSGDLARLRADGDLQFLGRADQQVKVRGHRIEPGEIEDALRRVPGIRDARVVARRSDGATELVAYYIPTGGGALRAGALREALLRSLPSYMVPKWFSAVEAIPLTRNGKIDVTALPDPARERDAGVELVVPASRLEQDIAAVWAQVLGVENVGTRDNFFDLGGDSLLLVRAAALLGERLRRRVEVVKLFEHPTIETLAAHLSATSGGNGVHDEIAARATRQRGAFLATRRR